VGGRRQLQASQAPAVAEADPSQPMETDASDPSPGTAPKAAAAAQTLAAKLSANLALKRKATDPPDNTSGSDKSKSRR
jgi:hypothetical protein